MILKSCPVIGEHRIVARVASVSVRFGSKELQSDKWSEYFWLSPHFPRRQNTENPVPRCFFAPKPHGNACYAG